MASPTHPRRGDAQAMFGDSVLDEVKPPRGDEPRDAVDAYYPMLDVQASAPSPSAFVTETMAELYLQQGYVQEALDIYRQLAAQNPGDETLRERVRQLEQGSRSSVGMAAISDDVVQAAHKRATTQAEEDDPPILREAGDAPRRRARSRQSLPVRTTAGTATRGFQRPQRPSALRRLQRLRSAPRRAAPELEEPAWLRSDAQPEPEPPQASHQQEDVPWLAGYEPDPVEPSPSQELPRPHTGGDMIAIPPSELFPTRSIAADDENAAAKLASVFEPDFAARLTPVHPLPTQRAASRGADGRGRQRGHGS